MIARLEELLEEIGRLQDRVAEEVSRNAGEFGYQLRQGKVYFEQEVWQRHREMATRIRSYLAEATLPVLLTAPLIYSLLIPLALLDLFVWLYQRICFPVYGIPRVRRSDYLVFDRHRLRYLNGIERSHCLYCAYANGLLAYVVEVAARTEQYWCPIRHARQLRAHHSRYHRFLPYGDAQDYTRRLVELRKELKEL